MTNGVSLKTHNIKNIQKLSTKKYPKKNILNNSNRNSINLTWQKV